MTRRNVSLGIFGEDLACRELQRRGYAILARRWRRRAGEIDIIARDGGVLVFVEVKARDGAACGTASEAVSARKRRRIARLAMEYVSRRRMGQCPCRFDVVAVDMDGDEPVVRVIQNAFDAGAT
jgi:putative endonuclease